MSVRRLHLLIALLVFVVEILIATSFARVGWIRSFLGDYLVVLLIYHLVQAIRPSRPLALAAGVFVFSCLVEVSQLLGLADALGFREPGLVRTLLGASFSWVDLLMYLAGCLTAYGVDRRLLGGRPAEGRPAAS